MNPTVEGKTAFITGAASGIGRAMARRCLDLDMRVVAADIDEVALAELARSEACLAVACDVTNLESLRNAADRAKAAFGPVHVLVNNAGAFAEGGAGAIDLERFRWVIDVNLMSVVMGVEVFLPQLMTNAGNAHVLNTASVAGHIGFANLLAYSTSKHAVVGYTESLAEQLAGRVSVSMLCPGFVSTRIAETSRYDQGGTDNTGLLQAVAQGMSADTVASYAIDRLLAGDRYIFTHPGTHGEVTERFQQIEKAFQRTETDQRILSDPDSARVASRSNTEEIHR